MSRARGARMPAVPAICGPTASGKSAAALAVAARLPVEIVSVDSAQVYRGMDIGTAKPSAEERAAVPHHLIDLVDPADPYSAARFAADARAAIAAIRARGRLPLLAGGTMLYLRALSQGLDDLPSADAALRARLEDEAARAGWPAMHARLAAVDPVTAARLSPNDGQRIQRALEVFEASGEPMSAWLARSQAARTGRGRSGGAGVGGGGGDGDGDGGLGASRLAGSSEAHDTAEAADAPVRIAMVSLEPSDRAELHARIARRFDAMLAAGLLDEVRALRARGDLHPALPSIKSVGYRQAWEHLDGAFDAAALRERGVAATRQLAKRQLTWLRAMPERRVIDCLAPDAAEQVARAIEAMPETGG